jgi:hypothetical protein
VFPKVTPSEKPTEPLVAPTDPSAATALTLDQQIIELNPQVKAFLKEHHENLVAEVQAGAADSSAIIHFLPGE